MPLFSLSVSAHAMPIEPPRKPLPDFRLHVKWFLIGVAGFLLATYLGNQLEKIPPLLLLILVVPCWTAIVVFLFGYVVVYPFVHLVQRYRGPSQVTWLVLLVLDTAGITLGIVRILYLFLEILPDIWNERAKAAARKKTTV